MKLPLSAVKVKDRLREDLGDIEGLAESIKKWGLLHPIVVDDRRRLIAGARRLAACKLLGMRMIEVRPYGELSDAERREIELEENLRRKDLTAFERSRHTEMLEAVEEKVAKEEELRSALEHKSSREGKQGRPPDPTSLRSIARRIGLSPQELLRAEEHVRAAERYPILQRFDWSQAAAMRAAKALDAMPAPDRRKIVGLIQEIAAPATDGLKMIEQFERVTPEVREKVFDMRSSSDQREKSLAITYLAQKAPVPDPRAVFLDGVVREARQYAKRFEGDPFNKRLEKLADEAHRLADEIQAVHLKRAANLNGGEA